MKQDRARLAASGQNNSAEQALRQSEERLRAIYEHAPVGIEQVAPDGRLMDVNDTLCEMLGYSRAELLKLKFQDITHPNDLPAELKLIDELHRGQRPSYAVEKHHVRKDGGVLPVRVTSSVVRDAAGVAIYRISVVEDIRQRRREETALRESEERVRLALEIASIGFYDVDLVNDRVVYDTRAQAVLGLPTNELSYRAALDLTHPDDHIQSRTFRNQSQDASIRARYATETRIIRPDGQIRWIAVQGRMTFDESKTPPMAVRIQGVLQDITERKNAEAALRQSEAQFEQVIGGIEQVLWMTDVSKSTMLYISAGYERIWGRTHQSLLDSPRNWLEAIHPDDRPRVLEAATTKQASGEYDVEYRIIRPDGQERWIRDRAFPIRDENGNVHRIAGIADDITDRKRADAVLRDSVGRLRTLSRVVEQSPTSIVITDPQGNIQYVNPTFTQLTGYTSDEVAGQNPRILNSGLTPAETFRRMWQVISSGQDWHGEFCNRKKNGDLYWELAVISPIKDDAGQIVQYLAIKEDITARKLAEERLRDSEQRLRTIITTAVDAIITIDSRGLIESVNPAVERMFGFKPAELLGRNVSILMPEPYHEEHDGYLRSYLRTGKAKVIGIGREIMAQRKDGTTFPANLSVSEYQIGGRQMFAGIVHDLTERRRLERDIVEAVAEEQRRIGRDLHDGLCQQLTAIGLGLKVLEGRLRNVAPDEAERFKPLGNMVRDATTQARDIARGLAPVPVEAGGISYALRELAAQTERTTRIPCTAEVNGPDANLPSDAATNLYRIAQEAVTNALRHGHTHRIEIRLSSDDRHLTLEVRDDGIGMPARKDFAKGMGLRTMQYRARLIGGSLDIRPATGHGTIISCAIPMNRTTTPTASPASGKSPT
jgi:PAS domain S-box-containing protein